MYLMYLFFLRFTTFLSTYLWGSSTVIYIYIYLYSCSILQFHALYMFKEQQDHWQDDQENPHEASIFCGSKGLLAAPAASWCLLPWGVALEFCRPSSYGILWEESQLLGETVCEIPWCGVRVLKDALKYGWMMVNVECTTYHIFLGGFVFCSLKPETISQNISVYRRNCSCREAKTWMAWSTNMAIYSKVVDSRISPTILSWKPMGKQQLKAWSRNHSATSTIL